MARKPKLTVDPELQPPLGDLLEQLETQPGRPIPYPVVDDDIGGELLSVLSRGLYPNPLDCIREYVQNAVDGQATSVHIKVTGNSVIIMDDGEGMNIQDLVEARRFGISPKSIGMYVGFRGIGIYSGFDISNRLTITTKKAYDPNSYVLEFDFRAMRDQLEAERRTHGAKRISLTDLLSTYSTFRLDPEPESRFDTHYTMVQLEELSDAHIGMLADQAQLRQYILRNLPIDFDDKFGYKAQITRALRANVPGYNAVIVQLEVDNTPIEIISRPAIEDLFEPTMGFILNGKKERVAYYWACLHQGGSMIPDEYRDYQGFVYKVKGFTIGDNNHLRSIFKIGNGVLYRWYTGEIYVLDPNVIPNAARDDFEPNPPKLQLVTSVRDKLGDLQEEASKYQKRLRAQKKVEQSEAIVNEIEAMLGSTQHYDRYEEYNRLANVIQDLKGQEKAYDKQIVQGLIKRAEKLIQIVRRQINNPDEVPKRSITSTEEQVPPVGLFGYVPPVSSDTTLQAVPTQLSVESTADLANTIDLKHTKHAPYNRTMIALLEQLGWDLSPTTVQLVNAIDASVSNTIGHDTEKYRRLLDDIENKLTDVE